MVGGCACVVLEHVLLLSSQFFFSVIGIFMWEESKERAEERGWWVPDE